MSEICQFAINNRANHSDQLRTIIEIIEKLHNSEIDETDEKVVILKEDGKRLRKNMKKAERE